MVLFQSRLNPVSDTNDFSQAVIIKSDYCIQPEIRFQAYYAL